jgi:carbon monoxide dehydrogenase subunit G
MQAGKGGSLGSIGGDSGGRGRGGAGGILSTGNEGESAGDDEAGETHFEWFARITAVIKLRSVEIVPLGATVKKNICITFPKEVQL